MATVKMAIDRPEPSVAANALRVTFIELRALLNERLRLTSVQLLNILGSGKADVQFEFDKRDFLRGLQEGRRPTRWMLRNLEKWLALRSRPDELEICTKMFRLRDQLDGTSNPSSKSVVRSLEKKLRALDVGADCDGVPTEAEIFELAERLQDVTPHLLHIRLSVIHSSIGRLQRYSHWSDTRSLVRLAPLSASLANFLLQIPPEDLDTAGVAMLRDAAVNIYHVRGPDNAALAFVGSGKALNIGGHRMARIVHGLTNEEFRHDEAHYRRHAIGSPDVGEEFAQLSTYLSKLDGGLPYRCGGLRCGACFAIVEGRTDDALRQLKDLEHELEDRGGSLPLGGLTMRFFLHLLRAEALWAKHDRLDERESRQALQHAEAAEDVFLAHRRVVNSRATPSSIRRAEHVPSLYEAAMYHLLVQFDPDNRLAPSRMDAALSALSRADLAGCFRSRIKIESDICSILAIYPELLREDFLSSQSLVFRT